MLKAKRGITPLSVKPNGSNCLSKKDMIFVEGVITDAHQGGLFTVEYEAGGETQTLLAKPAGKLKKFNIKLVIGDVVEVEMSTYDLTKGRIKYRVK